MKPKTITTQVRMPESLHLAIKKDADERDSSMNAEIVRRLEIDGNVQKRVLELQALSDAMTSDSQVMTGLVSQHKKSVAKHKELVRKSILLMIDFIADKDKTPEKERDMSLELLRFLSSLDSDPTE